MAIPLTGDVSITDCLADVDRPNISTKNLRDQYLYYRNLDWPKDNDISISDIRGTAACIMPYGTSYNRKTTIKSTYDPSMQLLGENSVSVDGNGNASVYCQHYGGFSNPISVMAKINGILPSSGRFQVEADFYYADTYMGGQVEVHGYSTGYTTGAHKMYGYGIQNGPFVLGPFDIDPGFPYLMISMHNNLPGGSNRRQGNTRYRNVRAKLV